MVPKLQVAAQQWGQEFRGPWSLYWIRIKRGDAPSREQIQADDWYGPHYRSFCDCGEPKYEVNNFGVCFDCLIKRGVEKQK